MTDKAQRAAITISNFEVEGFMMPDGSYRMSQTSAAEAVGRPQRNAGRFLASAGIKALLGKTYTPDSIEVESSNQLRGQTRINALPLEVVVAYWVSQCSQGNKQAIALVMAMATETLDRRFDRAFGIPRTEAEYDQQLSDRVQQLQSSLDELADAYAEPDTLREENERLREQIRQLGGEPFQLLAEEDEDEV